MLNLNILVIITITCLLYPSKSISHEQNIRVIDGDTIHINNEKIRIWGIDAPEINQTCLENNQTKPCGKKARSFLIEIINKNTLKCETLHKDRYGRAVARCKLFTKKRNSNEKDLGSEMIRNGWALDYNRYSHGKYSLEEKEAKENKKGIWSSEFEAPWEWRRHKQTKTSKP